jgi:hypothetical protein
MVRQSEALSAWLYFLTPHVLGVSLWWCGVFCAVGGFGGGASIRWTRRLRDLCLRCVWLAGGEGGRWVAWGVVLGCGFCAAVEVYMA